MNPGRASYAALLAVLLLFHAGCGDRPDWYEDKISLSGPKTAGDNLIFLEKPSYELLKVGFGKDAERLEIARIPVCTSALLLKTITTDEVEQALIWCSETKELNVVDLKTEKVTVYELGSPFTGFETTDSGFLIAYFPSEPSDSDELFINASQLAVVDLKKAPGKDNPRLPALASYGNFPAGIQIAPVVTTATGEHQLAFVIWTSYISVMDLLDSAAGVVDVPLRKPSGANEFTPLTLKFVQEGDLLRSYFLTAQGSDLFELTSDLSNDSTDFADRISINLFPMAPGPLDFVLFKDKEDVLNVFSICAQSQAVLTIPSISKTSFFSIDVLPSQLELIEDGGQVLAIISSRYHSSLVVADLQALLDNDPRAFSSMEIPAPVNQAYKIPGKPELMLDHQSSASLVNIEDFSIRTLGATGQMFKTYFEPETSRFWTLTLWSGKFSLVLLDLNTLEPRSVQLDLVSNSVSMSLVKDKVVIYQADVLKLLVLPQDFKDRADVMEHSLVPFDGLL